jgi:hypothetical protein
MKKVSALGVGCFRDLAVVMLLLVMFAGCATGTTRAVTQPVPAASGAAPQEEWVTCSSHPDVKFRRGEACPICGMHGGGMGGMH